MLKPEYKSFARQTYNCISDELKNYTVDTKEECMYEGLKSTFNCRKIILNIPDPEYMPK